MEHEQAKQAMERLKAERLKVEMRAFYLNDLALRAMIDSCVHSALSDLRDPTVQEVWTAATDAVTMMAARLLSEDAELNALRAERDAYRRQCDQLVSITPTQIIIPKGDYPGTPTSCPPIRAVVWGRCRPRLDRRGAARRVCRASGSVTLADDLATGSRSSPGLQVFIRPGPLVKSMAGPSGSASDGVRVVVRVLVLQPNRLNRDEADPRRPAPHTPRRSS